MFHNKSAEYQGEAKHTKNIQIFHLSYQRIVSPIFGQWQKICVILFNILVFHILTGFYSTTSQNGPNNKFQLVTLSEYLSLLSRKASSTNISFLAQSSYIVVKLQNMKCPLSNHFPKIMAPKLQNVWENT